MTTVTTTTTKLTPGVGQCIFAAHSATDLAKSSAKVQIWSRRYGAAKDEIVLSLNLHCAATGTMNFSFPGMCVRHETR